jgi:hypothetical protein
MTGREGGFGIMGWAVTVDPIFIRPSVSRPETRYSEAFLPEEKIPWYFHWRRGDSPSPVIT